MLNVKRKGSSHESIAKGCAWTEQSATSKRIHVGARKILTGTRTAHRLIRNSRASPVFKRPSTGARSRIRWGVDTAPLAKY